MKITILKEEIFEHKPPALVVAVFQDVPDDWSSEKWNMWWQKHSGSWRTSGKYLDPMLVDSVKAQQRLLETVAEGIESNKP